MLLINIPSLRLSKFGISLKVFSLNQWTVNLMGTREFGNRWGKIKARKVTKILFASRIGELPGEWVKLYRIGKEAQKDEK